MKREDRPTRRASDEEGQRSRASETADRGGERGGRRSRDTVGEKEEKEGEGDDRRRRGIERQSGGSTVCAC